MGGKVTVIFIGGAGLSGTTLIERLLGEVDGFFTVGEIVNIWRGEVLDSPCGCGAPVKECQFWTAVFEDVFPAMSRTDAERAWKLQRSVTRTRHLAQLAFRPLRSSQFQARLSKWQEFQSRLYSAIQRVSGCNVIVDASKSPAYGLALKDAPGLDLRVLHLLRDSRAVAYSHWLHALKGHTKDQEGMLMHALLWGVANGGMELLRRQVPRETQVHYEELVRKPQETLWSLCRALGLEVDALPMFTGERTVELGANHGVWGKRLRFARGSIDVSLDMRWKTQMPIHARLLVTALTWPLLARYGYLRMPLPGWTRHRGEAR